VFDDDSLDGSYNLTAHDADENWHRFFLFDFLYFVSVIFHLPILPCHLRVGALHTM